MRPVRQGRKKEALHLSVCSFRARTARMVKKEEGKGTAGKKKVPRPRPRRRGRSFFFVLQRLALDLLPFAGGPDGRNRAYALVAERLNNGSTKMTLVSYNATAGDDTLTRTIVGDNTMATVRRTGMTYPEAIAVWTILEGHPAVEHGPGSYNPIGAWRVVPLGQ